MNVFLRRPRKKDTPSVRASLSMAIAFLMLLLPASSAAVECHVDQTAGNKVTFISDAPFEDFEGVTDAIDGYVYWSGDSLTAGSAFDSSQLYFEVVLDELDTGIGMRNEDMREDYLETDKYPYAKYKASIVEVRRKSNGSFDVIADGEMTIHGVTNTLRTQNTVTRDGDGYRIQSSFSVKLPDYNIDVPSLLFMRISEEIELELVFRVKEVKQ